jgi:hypothetical protein
MVRVLDWWVGGTIFFLFCHKYEKVINTIFPSIPTFFFTAFLITFNTVLQASSTERYVNATLWIYDVKGVRDIRLL